MASDDRSILLSALPPTVGQKRLAGAVALILLGAFLATIPFMQRKLAPLPAFIPIVDTVLFLNDLVTAVLLFAQFSVTRSRALLALACGYLFTAMIIVPHGLTFPDVFSPTGLLGANLQSTVWLYIFWHLGLPPAVLAYAWFKGRDGAPSIVHGPVRRTIVTAVCAVAALVCALTWLVTVGGSIVPSIMVDSMHASSVWHRYGAPPLVFISIAAISLLWWRRRSVLDLWLLIVLWAWFIETVLLSTTAYRYTLVWYAGRIYGLLSSFFVLLVLLSESTLLYARLALSVAAQERERRGRMMTMDALSASMAHEINQPLCAILANTDAGSVLLRKSPPDVGQLGDVLREIAGAARRIADIVTSIRAAFRTEPQTRSRILVEDVIGDVAKLLRGELEANDIALRLKLEPAGEPVVANRGQVQQVLLNLAANAIDALSHVDDRPKVLTIRTRSADGCTVVSVADNGPGVDPNVAARVFDAFFTTKPSGTGMGLAICRSLVSAHGGHLWLATDRSLGAAFHFSLPSAIDPERTAEPAARMGEGNVRESSV